MEDSRRQHSNSNLLPGMLSPVEVARTASAQAADSNASTKIKVGGRKRKNEGERMVKVMEERSLEQTRSRGEKKSLRVPNFNFSFVRPGRLKN